MSIEAVNVYHDLSGRWTEGLLSPAIAVGSTKTSFRQAERTREVR
jgi:hypothetical protein